MAAYLVQRAADGRSIPTLAMDRKAISHHHRVAGHPTPTSSEGVRQTFAGLRNLAAEEGRNEPRQARGLTAEALAAIRRTARLPRSGPTGRTESVENARRRGDVYVGLRAAAALRRIRPERAAPNDRVFGLRTGRAISCRLAAMAKAAGLGDGFSGHSPRVGMAQDLSAAGTGLSALMVAGRWKSERMPAHYSRAETAGRGAVARFYGDG